MKISDIHRNYINGNLKDMAQGIEKYGTYDFWHNYREYLERYYPTKKVLEDYSKVNIIFNRIKGRG